MLCLIYKHQVIHYMRVMNSTPLNPCLERHGLASVFVSVALKLTVGLGAADSDIRLPCVTNLSSSLSWDLADPLKKRPEHPSSGCQNHVKLKLSQQCNDATKKRNKLLDPINRKFSFKNKYVTLFLYIKLGKWSIVLVSLICEGNS